MKARDLRDAATIVALRLKAIRTGAMNGRGASAAADLLVHPDLLGVSRLVVMLDDHGDRDAAEELLYAVALIVMAGGWEAAMADDGAGRAWARAMRTPS